MPELSQELLGAVLGRTLEEAAFVFGDLVHDPPPFDGALVEARLAYRGAVEGELALVASPALAATLAANLLGEDEGGAEATGDDEDAVGELLNMIAGVLAAELVAGGGECVLGLPRVRRVAAQEHDEAVRRASAVASLVEEEGRRIDLAATVRRASP